MTICLPGQGFAAPYWTIRVSPANIEDDANIRIGKDIDGVMEEYYEEWKDMN